MCFVVVRGMCKKYSALVSSFKFQVLFVTYTTIQRLYNQQWNVNQVRSMDSANIVEYNKGSMHKIKWIKNKI